MVETRQPAGGACVVFGRSDDTKLSSFVSQLAKELSGASAGTPLPDACDAAEFWTAEDLAAPRLAEDGSGSDPEEREADWLAETVRAMAQATYFVIDLDSDREMALYLLGAREALTSRLTFAVHRGALATRWPHLLQPNCVNLDAPDWDDIRAKIRAFLPPLTTSSWNNGFRSSRVVRISAPPVILRRDGKVLGRANKGQSAGKRIIERWRLPGDRPQPEVGITFGGIEAVGVEAGKRDSAGRLNEKVFPVWLNSENVDMQMGRIVDRSVSSTIRARGANWTGLAERISDDAMFVELSRQMGASTRLGIGEAIATAVNPDSVLHRENGVQCVVHVATVRPAGIGGGYYAAGNMGDCLVSALGALHDYSRRNKSGRELKSVLFPLFGAGDGGLAPGIAAAQMAAGLKRWICASDSPSGGHAWEPQDPLQEAVFIAREAEIADAIRKGLHAHGFERVVQDGGAGLAASSA